MKSIILLLALFYAVMSFSQTATVSGIVTDNSINQSVIGAKVTLSSSLRALSDFDGRYTINEVPFGKF